MRVDAPLRNATDAESSTVHERLAHRRAAYLRQTIRSWVRPPNAPEPNLSNPLLQCGSCDGTMVVRGRPVKACAAVWVRKLDD